jgi:hypothetical protein
LKVVDPKTTAARAFVRSLNILLKFARLYGFDHVRTVEQFDMAWGELRAAIPDTTDAGLLLGATGSQLLLDGVPLEGAPTEKQFAELLSSAGVGSVQFFRSIAQDELNRFVRAFPTGKSKPAELALQLKAALSSAGGIRINEICFVATDSRMKEAGMAAQLASVTLGNDSDKLNRWLNDPQKLLEMIAAAQGSKGPGSPGSAIGSGGGAANGGASAGDAEIGNTSAENGGEANSAVAFSAGPGLSAGRGSLAPSESEMYRILTALTSFGQMGATGGAGAPGGVPGSLHEELSQLPVHAQDVLKQALAELAAKTPAAKPDQAVLIQLAEHLAIRFALERFERGEMKVNAVRQMLDHMNHEIRVCAKYLARTKTK